MKRSIEACVPDLLGPGPNQFHSRLTKQFWRPNSHVGFTPLKIRYPLRFIEYQCKQHPHS
jgi:hypothetical protein